MRGVVVQAAAGDAAKTAKLGEAMTSSPPPAAGSDDSKDKDGKDRPRSSSDAGDGSASETDDGGKESKRGDKPGADKVRTSAHVHGLAPLRDVLIQDPATGAPWNVRFGAFSLFRLLTYVCSSAASNETGASMQPPFANARHSRVM